MQKGINAVAKATAKEIRMDDEPLMMWVFLKMSSNVHTDKAAEQRVASPKR